MKLSLRRRTIYLLKPKFHLHFFSFDNFFVVSTSIIDRVFWFQMLVETVSAIFSGKNLVMFYSETLKRNLEMHAEYKKDPEKFGLKVSIGNKSHTRIRAESHKIESKGIREYVLCVKKNNHMIFFFFFFVSS